MERSTILSMGKSTISTGPCSIANCNKLPEGKCPHFSHHPTMIGMNGLLDGYYFWVMSKIPKLWDSYQPLKIGGQNRVPQEVDDEY